MGKSTRAIIAAILILSFALPAFAAEPLDCSRSNLKGRMDASIYHKSGGWFAGGFAGGLLLGLLGGGGVTLAAAMSSPDPKTYPKEDTLDLRCYLDGYEKKAKGKNTASAAIGGLTGTAAAVVVVLYLYSSLYSY